MTKGELRSFGTMALGKLAAEKINSYHQSLNKRDINDLFYLLNEIAKRVIYSNYRGIQTHLLDDTIAQVSEDILMLIHSLRRNISIVQTSSTTSSLPLRKEHPRLSSISTILPKILNL